MSESLSVKLISRKKEENEDNYKEIHTKYLTKTAERIKEIRQLQEQELVQKQMALQEKQMNRLPTTVQYKLSYTLE